jgi:hemerythrin-like metal-binding protein
MERCGYPGLAAHRKVHQDLRTQVEAMVDQFHAARLDPLHLLHFLGHWLLEHIHREDLAMARFLEAHKARD